MKKMHSLTRFSLGFLLVSMVFGCTKAGTQSDKLVAFVVPTLANPFFVQMKTGAEAAASAAHVHLLFQATPGGVEDAAGQNDIVNAVLARAPAALCLVPADSKGIIPAVVAANSAGVPVLNVDNRIDEAFAGTQGARIASYIGSDNRLGGRMAGDYIVKALHGKGRVALIEGLLGSDAALQRASGFHDAIDNASGIELVATETASWSREEALNKFLGMLQSHPDIDAVFAANDEMALGVITALQERGTAEQRQRIVVVGFDATPDGLKAVETGDMAATIAQDPREMGRRCIESAVSLAATGEISPNIPVPVVLRTASDPPARP